MFDEADTLDEVRGARDATGTMGDEVAEASSEEAAVLGAKAAAAGAVEAAAAPWAPEATLGDRLLCEGAVGRGWSCDGSVGLCGGNNIAPCAVVIGALLDGLPLLWPISRPSLTVRA